MPRALQFEARSWKPILTCLVCMQDIVGYTSLSQECEPEQIMAMLHELFMRYDALTGAFGVYKVETIVGSTSAAPLPCLAPTLPATLCLHAPRPSS